MFYSARFPENYTSFDPIAFVSQTKITEFYADSFPEGRKPLILLEYFQVKSNGLSQ